MGLNSRLEVSGLGPFQNLMQCYFGGLDTAAQGFEPAFKGIARWQLEAMGLMSRRAQAYLELGSRLSSCRTPHDILNEHVHFWQTAFEQYADSSRRMTAALAQAATPPFTPSSGSPEQRKQRDYIRFPDARDAAPATAASRPAHDRRVA